MGKKFGDGIITTAALIIIGVLLFELIIFLHEGGHFITAKKSGIKVNEFALGMGPKIFSFTKGETTYSLRLFPIGGFCAMEGEDEESENPRAFNNAKVWKRMIVVIAGAVMNILLGIALMFVIVVQQDVYSSTTISAFPEMSYSANCGLQTGDTFKKINGYDILNAKDISFAIATSQVQEVDGKEVNIYKQDASIALCRAYSEVYSEDYSDEKLTGLVKIIQDGVNHINSAKTVSEAEKYLSDYSKKLYEAVGKTDYTEPQIEIKETRQRYRADVEVIRNGQTVAIPDVDFYTYKTADSDKPSVSIDFYTEPIEKTFFTVISETFSQSISIVRSVWSTLAGLVQGKFTFNDVSGPVGATSAITQVASKGLEESFGTAVNNIVFMMMVISINLGIVNMLPFPALDGGRFVFLLIEAIRKKPVPRKYEAYVNAAGMALLFLFMILITIKDVWQLFA